MVERRKEKRLADDNEISVTIVSDVNGSSEEKVIHSRSKDISTSGIRIQASISLPVDSILMMEMTLKILRQMITVLGKVRWNRLTVENESYEAGIEFFKTPNGTAQQLADYISWKQKLSKDTRKDSD